MQKKLLKYFAIFFALAVLLEETHCRTVLLQRNIESSAEDARRMKSRKHDHFHIVDDHRFQISEDEFQDPSKDGETLDQLLDEYIELSRKEATSELNGQDTTAVGHKQNQKRSFLNTFMLVNGAINAAFDIYRYEEGCSAWKKLTDNLKEIESTISRLTAKQDAVNLAWNIFYTNYSYYERLHSHAVIINAQAELYEQLKDDVVLVIDPDINTKLAEASAELDAEIEAENITTDEVDYSYLEEKFLTKFELAYSLFKNLKSLAWIAAKGVVKKIIDLTSSEETAEFVEENPTRFQRFLDYASEKKATLENWYDEATTTLKAKIEEFKLFVKTKFIDFVEAHPTLRNAYEYVAGDIAARARWVAIKNKLITLGKGIIVAGFVAYDIYLLAEFVKTCDDRQDQSQVLLDYLKGNETYMDTLLAEVNANITDLESNYTALKAKFYTTEFTAYLEAVQDLITNSSDPTPAQETAVTQIQTFIDEIQAANQERTDELMELLITALNATTTDIKCLYTKLHIMQDAYGRCSNGYDTFANIYTYVSSRSDNEVSSCYSTDALTEDDVKSFIYSQLADNSKQNVCIWNSVTKQQSVCSTWFATDSTNSQIATALSITETDVEYFQTLCGTKTLSTAEKNIICNAKKLGNTSTEVIAEYFSSAKYSPSDVTTAYGICAIDSDQIEDICIKKGTKTSLDSIISTYSTYSSSDVTTAYTNCEPTENVKALICAIYTNLNERDADLITIYGSDTYDSVISTCSSKDFSINTVQNNPVFGGLINHAINKAGSIIDEIKNPRLIPSFIRKAICIMKNAKFTLPAIYVAFDKKYAQEAVHSVILSCLPKDASTNTVKNNPVWRGFIKHGLKKVGSIKFPDTPINTAKDFGNPVLGGMVDHLINKPDSIIDEITNPKLIPLETKQLICFMKNQQFSVPAIFIGFNKKIGKDAIHSVYRNC